MRLVRFLAAAAVAGLATGTVAAPRGFDARDLVQLDRVGAPIAAPDGERVAFTVRETDMDANKGVTGLWLLALDGGKPRRLTPEGVSIASPLWSPDGQSLYYLSAADGRMQLFRIAAEGGNAQQVSDYPLDVGSFKLSPDGASVAMSFDVFPDCVDLACTKQRLDEKAQAKSTGVLYERMFVRHWDTWDAGRRNQLFVAPIEDGKTGAARRVSTGIDGDVPSKPFGDSGDYAWAPDGQSLVFSVRVAGKGEPWSTNFDLYRVPAAGGTPQNLTDDNDAWDAAPMFSHDGDTLYYLAMSRPGFEADRFRIMARDVDGGDTREVAPEWDRSAGGLSLSKDGRTLYATTDDIGQHALYAIDVDTGKATPVVDRGYVAGYDLVGDRVVYALDTLGAPADLYAASLRGGGDPQRLTRFNEARLADVRFGEYEQFSFAGWNGEKVHGYVVKPWNFEEGKTYPVAFLIHGGPQGSFGNHFHYRWNPQTYAGLGFAAVMIDFHGSTGYGQNFTDAISQDWGGKPLEDLKKGYAAALDRYDFLDGERACALGASYGGYMVNWIAGNWQEPWDCLVNHDGVFDNRMMYYATEELWFVEWEHGGTQYDVPENYERFNPVNHVADWRVPMLVVQGELDYRIPVTQGLATFTALQRQGIPSQLLYFPDENHWVLKPHNSIQWHDVVGEWITRWTR